MFLSSTYIYCSDYGASMSDGSSDSEDKIRDCFDAKRLLILAAAIQIPRVGSNSAVRYLKAEHVPLIAQKINARIMDHVFFRRKALLALAAATYPRTGAHSPARILTVDALQLIAQQMIKTITFYNSDWREIASDVIVTRDDSKKIICHKKFNGYKGVSFQTNVPIVPLKIEILDENKMIFNIDLTKDCVEKIDTLLITNYGHTVVLKGIWNNVITTYCSHHDTHGLDQLDLLEGLEMLEDSAVWHDDQSGCCVS